MPEVAGTKPRTPRPEVELLTPCTPKVVPEEALARPWTPCPEVDSLSPNTP